MKYLVQDLRARVREHRPDRIALLRLGAALTAANQCVAMAGLRGKVCGQLVVERLMFEPRLAWHLRPAQARLLAADVPADRHGGARFRRKYPKAPASAEIMPSVEAGSGSAAIAERWRGRRLIFSRKGFDSVFGGRPSPVLPDGRMVSLPIPEPESPITYGDCFAQPDVTFADFLARMGAGRIRDGRNGATQHLEVRPGLGVHLDPDLRAGARKDRPPGWQPLFGQADAAARHLERMHAGPGDVFLFFGWFAHAEYRHGQLRYVRGLPRFQAVWGWMEIGDAAQAGEFAARHPWVAGQHPHFIPSLTVSYRPNVVYMATPAATGLPGIPGSAVMCYSDAARLTKPGCSPRWWSLPEAFHPTNTAWPMTYHPPASWSSPQDGHVTLQSAAIGQEFVVPINDGIQTWLTSLIGTATTW